MNHFVLLTEKHLSLLLTLLLTLLPLPAQAHKLKIFAGVDGDKISGFAYFPGGGKYGNGPVAVLDGQERHLADLTTDEAGAFTWQAAVPGTYQFVITTQDGHAARFTVRTGTHAAAVPTAGEAEPSRPAPSSDLEQLIDRAVARQLLPLREDLARSREETRLRDILGGIGYITGLFGIAAFVLAGRRRRAAPAEE